MKKNELESGKYDGDIDRKIKHELKINQRRVKTISTKSKTWTKFGAKLMAKSSQKLKN